MPLLAVPAGQGLHSAGEVALEKVPAEHTGPPPLPALMHWVEPSLSVKNPPGHAPHAAAEAAEFAVLKVFMGQGVGKPDPAGQ